MKKIILIVCLFSATSSLLFAQRMPERRENKEDDKKEEKEKGFKKEKLFTGGSVTASFYSGGSILGANPMFGYTLANWVDGGFVFNYTYSGRRDYIYLNDKIRQHVFGPGVFMRLYPVNFLFVQGQFEHNFTNLHYTDPFGFKTRDKADANSFLVGAGIAQGRQPGSNTFYYISLLVDVIKNPNSPYVNNVYDQNTGQLIRTDMIPIVRAGINIGLFQKQYDNGRGDGHRRPRNHDRY